MTPRWQEVAVQLECVAKSPTHDQLELGKVLGVHLSDDLPSPVAAALLRHALAAPLRETVPKVEEIPEALWELEDELGFSHTEELQTDSRWELSAWFEARYKLKTALGLRALQPNEGDVVESVENHVGRRVVSSIGADGRIYFKGRPSSSSWPNYLTLVAPVGAPRYEEVVAEVEANLRNEYSAYRSTASRFAAIDEFKLSSNRATPEAVLELEHLLESGERLEGPFQRLLERHPGLLAFLVPGHHSAYVIPQKRLGSEYVTDFLVVGLNSLGPAWVAVEIEAPRHDLLTKKGNLTGPVQHAVRQIVDWREWLTTNVAYAQSQLGLWGITNRVRGLVVIGRRYPQGDREKARARVGENEQIEVHSWDWLLREARNSLKGMPYRGAYGREFIDD